MDGEYQQQTITVGRGPEALWGRLYFWHVQEGMNNIADAQLENNTYLHEGSEC